MTQLRYETLSRVDTVSKVWRVHCLLSAMILLTQHIWKQFVYSRMSLKSELCHSTVLTLGLCIAGTRFGLDFHSTDYFRLTGVI